MRFFYHYPETGGTDGDMLDPGSLHEVAAAAERSGFDGFSLTEHPVPGARWLAAGGHQSLDPLVALAYVAAATKRLRLLTHLVVAPYRNPFLLAKAAATVDRLSVGRLILGLGAGYQKSEFYALGVDMQERNALFDEALEPDAAQIVQHTVFPGLYLAPASWLLKGAISDKPMSEIRTGAPPL